jgi:hypothetical protein
VLGGCVPTSDASAFWFDALPPGSARATLTRLTVHPAASLHAVFSVSAFQRFSFQLSVVQAPAQAERRLATAARFDWFTEDQ